MDAINKFFFIIIAITFGVRGQDMIMKEGVYKEKKPIDIYYLSNTDELVISTGVYDNMARNGKINKLTKYSTSKEKQEEEIKYDLMNLSYSYSQQNYRGEDYNSMNDYGKRYSYFNDSIRSGLLETKSYLKSKGGIFYNSNYTDSLEVFLVNANDKAVSNIVKENLFLKIRNIWSGAEKKIKLKKPDLARLHGKGFAKTPKRDYNQVSFKAQLTGNNSLEIITKSVDETNTISKTYITTYDLTGVQLSDRSFEVKLTQGFLINSKNNGGDMILLSKKGVKVIKPFFQDNLSVNNYCEDKNTGDIYIYGLIGKKKGMYVYNHSIGYYVIKYNKSGVKQWENVKITKDKKFLGKGRLSMGWLQTSLEFYNGKLCFVIGSDHGTKFMTYSFMDKKTGSELSTATTKFLYKKNYSTEVGGVKQFITTCYNPIGMSNKVFNFDGLVAVLSNLKVKQYMDSVKSPIKISYETYLTDSGIWMVETDSKSYYKVLYFEGDKAAKVVTISE